MKWLVCLLPLIVSATAGAAELESAIPSALPPLESFGKITRHASSNLEELFGEDTDLYQRYGMTEAVSGSFRHPDDPNRAVTITLGAMPSELAAYGLFATFYFATEGVQELGNGGLLNDPGLFFWHGTTFAYLKADGPEETRADDLLRAAKAADKLLGPVPARPPILVAFESVAGRNIPQYDPDHLLGKASLPPGLKAAIDGTEYFLSIEEVSGPRMLKEYRKSLAEAQDLPWPELDGAWGDDEDLGPITIVEKDDRLVGALASPGTEGLKEILLRLVEIPPVSR